MIIKKKKFKNKIGFIINSVILAVFVFMLLPATLHAASKISIKYDKKTVNYSSTQAKVTYNNKPINLKGTPGLIFNDTAVVSYKDVFVNSSIGVTSTYTSSTGSLILKKGSTTIEMKVGSKTAYVNGKKHTMDTEVKRINFPALNTTKIYVPSRFVTENFGLKYEWVGSSKTAFITGPLDLKYDGKNQTYGGTQGKVLVNGLNISLATMPGIIIDNTVLVRAKQVFSSSSIKAKYDYNSSKRLLTLTKGSNTLTFTMDSKIATVNGKNYTMDTKARVIKNNSTGKSYVMIPAGFTANNLGYNYSWNSSAKTSVITEPSPEPSPELGDDPVAEVDSESTYLSLNMNNENLERYNHINNIVNTDIISLNDNETTIIESITKSDISNIADNTFVIKSVTPFNTITSTSEKDETIVFGIENSFSVDSQYNFNESLVSCIASVYDKDSMNTKIILDLNGSNIKYDFILTEDKKTLTITVYSNYITNVLVGSKSSNDYIKIATMFPGQVTIEEDDSNIYINLPYTKSLIGDFNYKLSTNSLTEISSQDYNNHLNRIVISKPSDIEYFTSETETSFTITFINPDNNNDGETDVIEDDYNIKIPKPSGVNFSSIQNEDLYMNNKFTITIPGDYVSFYVNNPIIKSTSMVKSIDVKLTSDKKTLITVYCTSIVGYKLADSTDAVMIKVGKPKDIYKKIVLLDPGHGGTDPGATNSGFNEKSLNYSILYTQLNKYYNTISSDIKIYYTRTNDVFISLDNRAAFAKSVGADIFVSLHMNSAGSITAFGTEVYYSTSNNSPSTSGLTSKMLADAFTATLTKSLGLNNRGTKAAKFVVVHKNTVPAVLIELGFMSNKSDLTNLTNSDFQYKAAKSIWTVIESIFVKYPTKR